ncbi:MAG: phosphoglycerate mutase family protein [Kiritimatiellia bacterium]
MNERLPHLRPGDSGVEEPLTVVFVRHAQAVPQDAGEPVDPPLTELGRIQARRVAERLTEDFFDHVYVSDLRRARETAEGILESHPDTPRTVTPDLREVSACHFIPRMRAPEGEALRRYRRQRRTLKKFVSDLRKKHGGGEKVLVVAHGNIIRTLVPMFAGRSPRRSVLMNISNAAVTIQQLWLSGEAIVTLANCVKHLAPSQVT